MTHSKNIRWLMIALAVTALSFWNFSNLTGGEDIRAIHIVSLLICGAGLGVMLVTIILIIRKNE